MERIGGRGFGEASAGDGGRMRRRRLVEAAVFVLGKAFSWRLLGWRKLKSKTLPARHARLRVVLLRLVTLLQRRNAELLPLLPLSIRVKVFRQL